MHKSNANFLHFMKGKQIAPRSGKGASIRMLGEGALGMLLLVVVLEVDVVGVDTVGPWTAGNLCTQMLCCQEVQRL